jgi:hypothetical protein
MHAAISIVTNDHPNYNDPYVVIGWFMSHVFFAAPMALVVKKMLAESSAGEWEYSVDSITMNRNQSKCSG